MPDSGGHSGYLTVVVGGDNMLVRRPEKAREWFNLLHRMVKESKTRVMKTTEQFWAKKRVMDSEKMEQWLEARERIGARYQYTQDRPRSAYSMDRKQNKKRDRANSECKSSLSLCYSSNSSYVALMKFPRPQLLCH